MTHLLYILLAGLITFCAGYILSWINHGELFTRIKNARFYMKKCGYTHRQAWRRAGMTL